MKSDMDIKKLTDEVSVAGQISAADVAFIAEQGFKTIVCNRPDLEVSDQPTIEAVKQAAENLGLEVIFQPVSSNGMSEQDIKDFSVIADNVKTPMLAYCRTGTRCTILWALSEGAKGRPGDQIVALAANAGYDLSKIAARL